MTVRSHVPLSEVFVTYQPQVNDTGQGDSFNGILPVSGDAGSISQRVKI